MIDQDRFELHLRAALRAYAGGISSNVDALRLVHTIASAEPRRPFGAMHLHWPADPILRVGWVLVLVALLIAAAFAFGVGIRPPAELRAVLPAIPAIHECPPGSTPDQRGRPEQVRPPLGDIRIAVDRESGRIVAVVPLEGAAGWATWTFDVCANTWTRAGADADVLTSDRLPDLVYDWRLDLTLAVSGDRGTWVYDPGTGNWWRRDSAVPFRSGYERLVYDLQSGRVLAVSPKTVGAPMVWSYDVRADAWTVIRQSGSGPATGRGEYTLIAYDIAIERVVAVNTDAKFTLVLDPRSGAWANPQAVPPPLRIGWFAQGGEIAYDESAERVVVFAGGNAIAYDAIAALWSFVPEDAEEILGPQARWMHQMAYDPTNRRLVVMGGQYRTLEGSVRADDVWAFETATGKWTQLLAPSRMELATEDGWVELPAPSSP